MRGYETQFHAIRHPEARPLALEVPGAAVPKLVLTPWVVFPLCKVF